MSSLSTLAAFAAAATAVLYAARALHIENGREARLLESIERDQASKVAAWVGEVDFGHGPYGATEESPLTGFKVHLRNASELPVLDALIQVQVFDHTREVFRHVLIARVPVIPPGAHAEDRFFPVVRDDSLPLHRDLKRFRDEDVVARVFLSFADASGQTWARDHEGRLTKMKNPSRLSLDDGDRDG